jgi:hypothetical protein
MTMKRNGKSLNGIAIEYWPEFVLKMILRVGTTPIGRFGIGENILRQNREQLVMRSGPPARTTQ